ncbi:MAG TPA: 30S ribosomal protein S20 [Clostridia bacterium]|nr:30S ribosomal protein S20 [Clostridia bacterium]
MPNIKSAKKRVRVSQANAARNKSQNTNLKTAIKNARAAIVNNDDNKVELVQTAMKKVDQACTKGFIHKNNAARKKSALAKLIKEA